MESAEKRKAWKYAFGMIRVDGLMPSSDLLKMAEQEISGNITLEDIYENLNYKYRGNLNE